MVTYLRPEARPASWKDLDQTQQDGFVKIVKMLGEAIGELDTGHRANQAVAWLSSNRKSRSVFLSGGRGTGKTTLLTSLTTLTPREAEPIARDDKDFQDALRTVRHRVLWLEPIDMESMAPTANLLSAILARIEDTVRRSGETSVAPRVEITSRADGEANRPPGLLGVGRDYHEALLQLQRLQTEGALAWECNLNARQSHLDIDVYAVEVMRTEKARLSISRKLETALDAVATQGFRSGEIQSPIFILPIDDIDLNPLACLDVLKLLRMLTVPRLFTLLLGDVRVAELVLNLKLSNDLAELLPGARSIDLLSLSPASIAAMAGEVAANALRKLLPPTQRIQLDPLAVHEGLAFRPLGSGESDPRITDLLARLPSPALELSALVGTDAPSLQAFILVGGLGPPAATPAARSPLGDGAVYSGRLIFCSTPRRMADFWIALNELVGSPRARPDPASPPNAAESRRKLVDHMALLCQSSLAGDPHLTPLEREQAVRAIRRTAGDTWTIGALPFRVGVDSEPKPPLSLVSQGRGARTHTVRLVPAAHREWRFEVVEEPSGLGDAPRPSAVRAIDSMIKAELTLLHDLVVLGDSSMATALLDVATLEQAGWASTEWPAKGEPLRLGWLPPPLSSFWEMDLFLDAWNAVVRRPRTTTDDVFEAGLLLYTWVSSGTAALLRRRLTHPLPPQRPDWSHLSGQLEELCRIGNDAHDARAGVASEWLIRIALLIMPETVPSSISTPVQLGPKVTEFWSRETAEIVHRRAGRLAALVRAGLDEIADSVREVGRGRKFVPIPQAIQDRAGLKEQQRAEISDRMVRDLWAAVGAIQAQMARLEASTRKGRPGPKK